MCVIEVFIKQIYGRIEIKYHQTFLQIVTIKTVVKTFSEINTMFGRILILLAIAVAIAGAMNTKITTYEEEQHDNRIETTMR